MRRLIWSFAGRTYHIVGNLISWLICKQQQQELKQNGEHSIARLTNQLTLNAVALTEVTVTSLGAISGTAFNVMKPLVGELGSLLP